MNFSELKSKALESLKGKYGETIKLLLVYIGIEFILELFIHLFLDNTVVANYISPLTTIIISSLLVLGYNSYFLKISRNEEVTYKEIFSKTNLFAFCLLLAILISIFTTLWTLLLIIPGIIASISYSQAYFVALDNENLSAKECIDESKRLMMGHKMEYFLLCLSFIGWILLGILTLGILYFWLIPYISVTEANFYNELIKK